MFFNIYMKDPKYYERDMKRIMDPKAVYDNAKKRYRTVVNKILTTYHAICCSEALCKNYSLAYIPTHAEEIKEKTLEKDANESAKKKEKEIEEQEALSKIDASQFAPASLGDFIEFSRQQALKRIVLCGHTFVTAMKALVDELREDGKGEGYVITEDDIARTLAFCNPEFKVTLDAKERAGAEDSCSDVGSLGLGELGLNWDAIE